MIERHWRGLARKDSADAYVRHLQSETFPAMRKLAGFLGASILRRTLPTGVEFLVTTQWLSMESIRAFAGDDPEVAVVPEKVRSMMLEYDEVVRHYEVVE
jgi:heme-degrading monooxygenase HmoA